MFYYNILPASSKFFSKEPITYSANQKIGMGCIAEIELGERNCLGIVVAEVSKPEFATKPIAQVSKYILNKKILNFIQYFLEYYPNFVGPVASMFLPKKLSSKLHNKKQIIEATIPPKPSKEQLEAIDKIEKNNNKTTILHGITGSGKTLIYLELAKKALKRGESCIILVPEISLTPKIASDFAGVFNSENLVIFHSKVTAGERNKLWQEVYREPKIIIGPRSSLFLPVNNLGLIVVDEFHDSSYTQDSQPSYSAIKVASLLRNAHDSKLIFGSATPPINDYFLAENKHSLIINLSEKAKKSNYKIDVKIIDMRDRDNLSSSSQLFSKPLLQQIKNTLSSNKQVLIFLNRRGTSRTILCSNCGWQSLCNNCNIPQIYHHDLNRYFCHECGKNSHKITKCPACSFEQIFYKSPGTKQAEKELSTLFPLTNIARFDGDNIKSESINSRYSELDSGKINIIIGTQILIKGHDLKNLGLVAMLQADSYLQYPDYTSKESLFQAVNQLYGRIDRGHNPGIFLLQTFNPDNDVISQALHNSWGEFYRSELVARKKFRYPPFVFTLKITHSLKNHAKVIDFFDNLSRTIQTKHPKVIVEGPAPMSRLKENNRWQYQIIVKSKDRKELLEVIRNLPTNCKYIIDPSNLT